MRGRFVLAFVLVCSRAAADSPDLFRSPALSATPIVFSFAGDLWSVPRTGGDVPTLLDGGVVTAPGAGFRNRNGRRTSRIGACRRNWS